MALARSSLDSVNMFRSGFLDCRPLSWDRELADGADSWAERGVFAHSVPAGKYGECLAIVRADGEESAVSAAVNLWAAEESLYDRGNPRFSSAAGHFTQLVWKRTSKLGVGTRRFPDGRFLVVARFVPPGNVSGQFADQVPSRRR